MSRTQAYEWTEKFKNSVTSVEDSPRPGPAFTAVSEDNIAALENVIRENRRVTFKEVASLLDISVGSAHHMIHDELKIRRVCAGWVPKRLTPEMKERRVGAFQELVRRCEADEAFLRRIVTGDESWVHFYEPEGKRQSMEWRHTSSPKPKICRQSHVDFLLELQRADLRALHAQRKHCDQCHLLKPSEGKSEANYSSETARVFDDGSVSPRQCEATYCYNNSVDY